MWKELACSLVGSLMQALTTFMGEDTPIIRREKSRKIYSQLPNFGFSTQS